MWNPGSAPEVFIDSTLDICKKFQPNMVLVVDDVVSSGRTLEKVYEHYRHVFCDAKWVAATWVTQAMRQATFRRLSEYDRVLSACVVQKTSGERVPINSLSTLRKKPELAFEYAHTHFISPKKFRDLVATK